MTDERYALPEGWGWTNIGDLSCISTGKLDANAANEDGQYPFFTCADSVSLIDTYAFDTEAVLLAGNGNFNAKWYQGKFNAYQRTYVIEPYIINGKYLYHVVTHEIPQISKNERGSTIQYLRLADISNCNIPLAPREEQDRIVEKIERLFGKIEAGQTQLEKLPRLLKQFRQTVLAAACSGRLVPQDPNDDNILIIFEQSDYNLFTQYSLDQPQPEIPSNWQWVPLGSLLVDKPRNGYSPKAKEAPPGIKTLKLGATTKGYFDSRETKWIDEEISSDSYLWLEPGDLLIQRANSLDYVGISAIYTGQSNEFIYPDLIMKAKVKNESVLTDYIWRAINSPYGRHYCKNNAKGTAGNMPKINQETVLNFPIPLPPKPEQEKIVEKVVYYLKLIDTLEQFSMNWNKESEQLKQTILSKAFRGELVEQCPTDEPASILLERIHAEKAQATTNRPKKVSSRKKKELAEVT